LLSSLEDTQERDRGRETKVNPQLILSGISALLRWISKR
jgi:hypothetical protein